MRARKLRCYMIGMGGDPPVSRQLDCLTELPDIDWGTRLPAQSRGWEFHRVLHLSSCRRAPVRPCPPRADNRRRSPSAAKPHWITDDGPSAASTTTHHPKLPLVGINAPSGRENISPRRHV